MEDMSFHFQVCGFRYGYVPNEQLAIVHARNVKPEVKVPACACATERHSSGFRRSHDGQLTGAHVCTGTQKRSQQGRAFLTGCFSVLLPAHVP